MIVLMLEIEGCIIISISIKKIVLTGNKSWGYKVGAIVFKRPLFGFQTQYLTQYFTINLFTSDMLFNPIFDFVSPQIKGCKLFSAAINAFILSRDNPDFDGLIEQ